LGLLARPTKVNDLAHPALDEPLRGDAGPSHVASGPNTPIPWRRVRAGAPAGRGTQVKLFGTSAFGSNFRHQSSQLIVLICYLLGLFNIAAMSHPIGQQHCKIVDTLYSTKERDCFRFRRQHFFTSVRKARNSEQQRCQGRSAAPLTKGLPTTHGPSHASATSCRCPPHRGTNQVEPSHLPRAHQAVKFRRRKASGFVRCRTLRVAFSLRTRPSRTTSPPPSGLSESASDLVSAGSGLAATGTGTLVCVVALCSAGGRAASRPWPAGARWSACPGSWASASAISSNCKPNCTEGSKKPFTAAKGTANRSGTPPKDTPTSKPFSFTTRSQNWCCRTTVISVGYCASMRGDRRTPSARVSKEM